MRQSATKTFIFSILCFLNITILRGQAEEEKPEFEPDPTYTDNKKHKEFILNLTPLVAQFVPFNASTVSKLNIFDYQYRRLKNGKGWRFGLGANINLNDNNIADQFLYLRFGRVRRSQVSRKFHFTRGFDAVLAAEDDGLPTSERRLGFSGLGVMYSIGAEYSITSRLTLSTEGSLFFGVVGDENFRLRFLPPVGLFIHFKL